MPPLWGWGLPHRRGGATRSTIITSQLPPTQYHDYIGEPTLADSICDRLLHNSHRIVLQGPSRRKEDKLDT
jgi:DNA replication protein DnaC